MQTLETAEQARRAARNLLKGGEACDGYLIVVWGRQGMEFHTQGHVAHKFPIEDFEEALAQARRHFVVKGYLTDDSPLQEADLPLPRQEEDQATNG